MIIEYRCPDCDCVFSVELNPGCRPMTPRVARRVVREAGREHRAETDHAAADVTERT